LDVPIGTGRFLKYFGTNDNTVYGIDISKDMITQAMPKWEKYIPKENKGFMQVGDVFNLPFDKKTIDYIVCIRLLNWMNIDEVSQILQEFKRVSNNSIIVSIRVNQELDIKDLMNLNNLTTGFKKIKFKKTLKDLLNIFLSINKASNIVSEKVNPSSGYVHNNNDIQDIISRLGLMVREVHLIEQRIKLFKKIKQPFFIYWLDVPDKK
jgi:2-polyprenyl-3-methyl-5-hydroxy-6-metoxy-1,4-benzoquinol methylase